MADDEESVSSVKTHHKQAPLSYKRPKYREARWERSIKVYTINLESKYVLVQGVPAVGATDELLKLFALYGAIEEYRLLDEYPTEPFTEVYWIKFVRINSARIAKKKLDNWSFFGGILHVCYAPEYETVDDTREKVQERRKVIAKKTRELYGEKEKEAFSKTETFPMRTLAQGQNTGIVKSASDRERVELATGQACSSTLPSNSRSDETNPAVPGTCMTPSCFTSDYPALPLPPQHLPPHQLPPPPSPWGLPRVPSAHSTLPAYLQYFQPPPPPPPPLPPPPPPPPPPTPLPSSSCPEKDAKRQSVAAPHTVYMSQVMIGPQLPENSRIAETRSSLTGDDSLDNTVASIRKKMRMVSNSQPSNFQQSPPMFQTPVESVSSVPKKKRKRI